MNEHLRKDLQKIIRNDGILMPGVFNAITAKIARQAGFKGLYISGAGLNNSAGFPDIGLLTLTEFINQTKYITAAVDLPCICDADTGFGEAVNMGRCVEEFEQIGMAGIHVEDQVFPKRCGHLSGKSLIPAEEMAAKIKAACRSRRDKNFLIIARTDARSVEGFDSAVQRADLYIKSGADVIFPEALQSETEFRDFAGAVKTVLMANMTEFGVSPLLRFEKLRDMGYGMVIFPMTAFRVMMKACENLYKHLMKNGSQVELLDQMQTRKELYELLEYEKYAEVDSKVSSFQEGL